MRPSLWIILPDSPTTRRAVDSYAVPHVRRVLTGLLCLLSAAAWAGPAPQADPDNAQQVQRGKHIYQRFCALCHGVDLQGQPNWRQRKADGKLPAPPHDASGHTWHHPDAMLFGIIKQGLVPPYAPPDYATDMPAWGDTLRDTDIWAVLAYIKSRWSAETRKMQQELANEAATQALP